MIQHGGEDLRRWKRNGGGGGGDLKHFFFSRIFLGFFLTRFLREWAAAGKKRDMEKTALVALSGIRPKPQLFFFFLTSLPAVLLEFILTAVAAVAL